MPAEPEWKRKRLQLPSRLELRLRRGRTFAREDPSAEVSDVSDRGVRLKSVLTIMFFFGLAPYVLPTRASALGTSSAHQIPCSPRQVLNRMSPPPKTATPATTDHTAYHANPSMYIFRCPYISPSRPAGRMKVPSVRLKAAGYQLSCASSVTLKPWPMMLRGAMVCASPARERNWAMQITRMKRIWWVGEKGAGSAVCCCSSSLPGVDPVGFSSSALPSCCCPWLDHDFSSSTPSSRCCFSRSTDQ